MTQLELTYKDLFGNRKIEVDVLPEHCCMCPFHTEEYVMYRCSVTGRKQMDYTGMKRMRGCPLKLKED